MGGVREARGEGAGSGIPKQAGDREKLRKISQNCVTFYNRNRTEAGARMEEGGKREFKVRETGVSDPLSPSTNYTCQLLCLGHESRASGSKNFDFTLTHTQRPNFLCLTGKYKLLQLYLMNVWKIW